jgi:hypothetical protein
VTGEQNDCHSVKRDQQGKRTLTYSALSDSTQDVLFRIGKFQCFMFPIPSLCTTSEATIAEFELKGFGPTADPLRDIPSSDSL